MKDNKVALAQNLDDAISEAADCVNAFYPLTNFIACNALKGWENIPFAEAMRKSRELFWARGFLKLSDYRAMYETGRIAPQDLEDAFHRSHSDKQERQPGAFTRLSVSEMLDQVHGTDLVEIINKQMIKWCGAYLDRTQAQWRPNAKAQGLYEFWKDLAGHDFSMWLRGVWDWSDSVSALPQHSSLALNELLTELQIQGDVVSQYLQRHIAKLPGFASHLKWLETEQMQKGIMRDFLAIRLHYEKMLANALCKKLYKSSDLACVRSLLETKIASMGTANLGDHDDYEPVWQEAYELNYRNQLLSALDTKSTVTNDNAACQLVFCIDVRSEPMRRKLEQLGPYSTYGFAGFFGMAMRLTEIGSALPIDLCPVLIKPQKQVVETAAANTIAKRISWQALKVGALQLKKKLKCNLAGAFGLVELLGVCSAVPLIAKTFSPFMSKSYWRQIERSIAEPLDSKLDLSAFSLDDKVSMAAGAIAGIGLEQFGKVVVLCGHKSSSTNNPFASSLDCGACGGNGGGYSARLAAQILNDKAVREQLSLKGINVPSDCVFIAAEHNTTTDEFVFFDAEELTEVQVAIVSKLKNDLLVAGRSLAMERAQTLPESALDILNDPAQRACDWAQIAPEWGLAGNAAFIAGPRQLTKSTDLNGRVFLHSYEYTMDKDDKVLELIMTAPLVVAQWINMQYYLSTVDNSVFGSGSKVVHNVIGDFGVMQGAASDLRIGLPLQSIKNDDQYRHEPLRLLSILRAPLASIDRVLAKHAQVRQLVANRWIRLVSLNPADNRFYEADDCGKWRQIELNPHILSPSPVVHC